MAKALTLPKGTLRLADGRTLQPLLGYDVRKTPGMDAYTRRSILASRGWKHWPTGLMVSATIDDTEKWGPLVHVSMSYPDHDPTWTEIKQVRDLFFPKNVDAMMMLPRQELYVNVHNFCYHLWQTPQAWEML